MKFFYFRYFDRKDFQYVAMDTDSAYMALSAPMDNIVRKEIADIYYKEYGKWFPRMYCDRHADDFQLCKSVPTKLWELQNCCKEVYQYDIRTPGLFKVEFSGHGIVALNSKTYFCWNDETHSTKHSSKGLSKTTNSFTKDTFLKVLHSRSPKEGVNKGFVKKDNRVFSYTQLRTGLTYFYSKRRVCNDGVSTEYILA